MNDTIQSWILSCTENYLIFLQLFSKLVQSLYLLNYWLFQECKIPFLSLKRALNIWAKKLFSLNKQGSYQKHYFGYPSKSIFHIFWFLIFFIVEYHRTNILIIHQNRYFQIFDLLIFSIYSHLWYFRFLYYYFNHVQELWLFIKK